MGAALKRPFKMYNIEARAQKVLEKGKTVPNAAPRYPSEKAIEARYKVSQLAEDAELHKKHMSLDSRLKHVYVESKGDNPVIQSNRKLPENRFKVEDPEYGYLEPVNVTEGRIPLRLAVEMINTHKDDPQANSAYVLSEKYKLDLQTTHHILEYFKPFNLKLPKAEELVKSPLPLLRDRTIKHTQKRLDSAQKILDDYQNKSKT